MHPKNLRIDDFSYELPAEKIALHPNPIRGGSKLLVSKKGEISESTYNNINNYLPPKSFLVFNQTKVVNARLLFKTPTGANIEIFCLNPAQDGTEITSALSAKSGVEWKCLVGNAKKWKPETTPSLVAEKEGIQLEAVLIAKDSNGNTIQFKWKNSEITFAEILNIFGDVPLPPYINRTTSEADNNRYQTIFAKQEGSVAAPTAGLHFTEEILKKITDSKNSISYVTLHVGAGTFMPVKTETISDHLMHAEWIEFTDTFVQQLLDAKKAGNPIIPVGTTSMRTIESIYQIGSKLFSGENVDFDGFAVQQWDPYEKPQAAIVDALQAVIDFMLSKSLKKTITRTQIIIAPGYQFVLSDGLVTNFHQPKSTLLLLVSALVGKQWRDVYDYALHRDFRFLSYGDGCLLLPY